MVLGIFGVRKEQHHRSIQLHAAEREAKPLQSQPGLTAEQEPQAAPPLQAVPADCPAEPCSGPLQDQGRRFLKGLRLIFERIKQVETQQQSFVEKAQRMEQNYLQELGIIRACQQQTAEILNYELERHALNPAIDALVSVAEEFRRLEQTVTGLKFKDGLCPAWKQVADELKISLSVVEEKLRAQDVVILRPACNEPVDVSHQDLCGQIETGDVQLQGKIQSVVSCGIQYRNKLLKRARVIVYRFKSN